MAKERDPRDVFALRVWGYKQGEVVSLMIHLGDRLGLYREMAGAGPVTAASLAASTGMQERWLLEWLRGQGAAGLLDTQDGDSFELTAAGAAVLADSEDSLVYAAGAFGGGVAPPAVVDRLAEAFRTGTGLSYEQLGPAAAHTVERLTEPALDGVIDRLCAGALVADVGCGSGVAVDTLAAAFPAARIDGYDPSAHAIERARQRLARSGHPNAEFTVAGAEDLPAEPRYDLILTLDCIHDMPRPAEAIAAIRKAIKPDGTWLIKDIKSAPTWAGNLRNPVLAMMYGLSVASCLSSALSEPGGAGLGTLGFGPGVAELMCREAGFSRFTPRDFDDPANLYYEVRP
jgi:2-polyprenyl-3-methyl-5-hydroxy-6-metoxy-1,4-benzoquinol methylase